MLPPSLDVEDPAADGVRGGTEVAVPALEAAFQVELDVPGLGCFRPGGNKYSGAGAASTDGEVFAPPCAMMLCEV